MCSCLFGSGMYGIRNVEFDARYTTTESARHWLGLARDTHRQAIEHNESDRVLVVIGEKAVGMIRNRYNLTKGVPLGDTLP